MLNPANGHFYQHFGDLVQWDEANTLAKNQPLLLGYVYSHLVTIASQEEQDFLESEFANEIDVWIGLTDAELEGDYRWITGEPFVFENRADDEPNNFRGDEDYGIFGVAGGGWNDGVGPTGSTPLATS